MTQTELNPYPTYWNSGVEWLGDVPAHWETQRLKSVAGNISEQTLKRPKGMGYIALEHVERWTGRVTCEGAEPGDGQLKLFRPGDVPFGKLRPYLAKVVHAKSHGGICAVGFFGAPCRIAAGYPAIRGSATRAGARQMVKLVVMGSSRCLNANRSYFDGLG